MTVPLSWDSTDEDEDGAIAPSDGSAGGVPPQDDAAGGPPPAPAGVAGAGRPDWIRRMLQSSSEEEEDDEMERMAEVLRQMGKGEGSTLNPVTTDL